jgi:hypothetical protein
VAFFVASIGLHAAILLLVWGAALAPPVPVRVELFAPPVRPGESNAPRGAGAGSHKRRAPEPKPAPAAKPEAPPAPHLQVEPAIVPPVFRPASAPASGPDADAAAGFRPVTDVSGYGPGDARLTLVLRTDRIRQSPFAADLRAVLARFPDHRVLAARTGLDPVGELDSILISTANPFDVTATFLAARYGFSEARFRRLFEDRAAAEGGSVAWRTSGGRPVGTLPPAPGLAADPRVLVLLRPGLAVFTRPEHVATLTDAAGGSPDGGAGDWSARLSLLEVERGGGPDGPVLLLTLADMHSYVRAKAGETMPIPRAGRLMVEGLRADPTAYVELIFDTPAQATSFAAQWPARAQRWAVHPMVFFTGLGGAIRRVEARPHGDTVRGRLAIRPAELRQLLRIVAQAPPAAPASQPASTSASRSAPASAPATQRAAQAR